MGRSFTFACPTTSYPPWTYPTYTQNGLVSLCGGIQGIFIRKIAAQQSWNVSFRATSDAVMILGNSTFQGFLKIQLEGEAPIDVVAGLPEIPTLAHPNACPGTCRGLLASYPIFSGNMGVAIKKERSADDFSRLFSPFTASVWCAAALTILVLATSLVAIKVINPRTCKSYQVSVRSFTDALYHAVLSTLGAEDDLAPWPSGPARIIRIVSALFTLVLVAAYTANLAAFFTAPAMVLIGPKTLTELYGADVCVPLPLTEPAVAPFVGDGRTMSAPTEVAAASGLRGALEWCHRQILEGRWGKVGQGRAGWDRAGQGVGRAGQGGAGWGRVG